MPELKKMAFQSFSSHDLLFGDLPLSYWAATDAAGEPWTSFKKVKNSVDENDEKSAINTLREIINMSGLESRQYLQAHYFLNEILGVFEKNLKLFGVIVEIGMAEGQDTLAVYADHSARYFNYSGKSIIWQNADDSLDTLIDDIFKQSANIVSKIGPWQGTRPSVTANGMARINFLTSHGLHFGEAGQRELFNDPLAGKTMYALQEVMERLIGKTNAA